MFKTITEALNWLYTQKKLTKRENLERISRCADELKLNPSYKIIHVAGTNGKGSTASYIKSILKNTGIHVGFFVSPFVICFNERIQINDRYISNAEILHYINRLYEYSHKYYDNYNDIIPFFELTLLMALMFFKDRNIDLAIIECGIGGLLDATNFLKTDLAIITNIGFDHMATLGNTLEEIASHKLGIVKENMTCLTCVSEDLRPQFDLYAKRMNAKIIHVDDYVSDIALKDCTYFKYKNEEYNVPILAIYQAYNASLALEAIRTLYPATVKDIIQFGFDEMKWPGRMEIISENPNIILDGAHNIHGIHALVETMKEISKSKKIKIVFSALHDKAYDLMLKELDSISSKYYFTAIQDLRGTDPTEFAKYTKIKYEIFFDWKDCLNQAQKDLKLDEVLLITGSLHFISIVREWIVQQAK